MSWQRSIPPMLPALDLKGDNITLYKAGNAAPRVRTPLPACAGTGRTARHAYWITPSAVASSVSGMVRPRALAVFRLMTNTNLVGCRTGRSPGLAPLKTASWAQPQKVRPEAEYRAKGSIRPQSDTGNRIDPPGRVSGTVREPAG
jgi:hypothetical protein